MYVRHRLSCLVDCCNDCDIFQLRAAMVQTYSDLSDHCCTEGHLLTSSIVALGLPGPTTHWHATALMFRLQIRRPSTAAITHSPLTQLTIQSVLHEKQFRTCRLSSSRARLATHHSNCRRSQQGTRSKQKHLPRGSKAWSPYC